MLAKGKYLGSLYDIGFDKTSKGMRSRRAAPFITPSMPTGGTARSAARAGPGSYALTDSFTGASLGTATRAKSTIPAKFERFLLVRATPAPGGKA